MIGEFSLVRDSDAYSGGTTHRLRLAEGLPAVLERLAVGFAPVGEGVVLARGPAAHALGLPAGIDREVFDTREAEFDKLLDTVRARGWRVSRLREWTTFHGKDRPTIHLGLLTYLTSPDLYPFAGPGNTSLTLTPYLHRVWWEMTGSAYRGTPGVAGTAMIRELAAAKSDKAGRAIPEPTWRPAEPGRIGMELAYLPEHWSNKRPQAGRYEHGYDCNYMYLSAWSTVEVASYGLRQTGAVPFDRRRSGWWLATYDQWNEVRLPDPAGYGEVYEGKSHTRWVTTPTLALLEDLTAQGLHGGFEVLDSWTAPSKRSVLLTSAEKFRDVLYTLDAIDTEDPSVDLKIRRSVEMLISAAKAGYRQSHGLMNREGGRIYRPDWYSAIVAQARCNLWRKMFTGAFRHGYWPLRVDTDKVWYPSDEADPRRAAPPNFTITDDDTEVRRLGAFHLGGTRLLGGAA